MLQYRSVYYYLCEVVCMIYILAVDLLVQMIRALKKKKKKENTMQGTRIRQVSSDKY